MSLNAPMTDIDALLEKYLIKLDEYTRLRDTLNTIQARMYQNLARANFSAERGVRYGQDFYDERMQAGRRLRVQYEDFTMSFTTMTEASESEKQKKEEDSSANGATTNASGMTLPPTTGSFAGNRQSEAKIQSSNERPKLPSVKPNEPLRWFGLLTPQPLRLAQLQAVAAIEEIVPRLATVSAAMRDLEIEVQRERKRTVKAEGHAEKERREGEAGMRRQVGENGRRKGKKVVVTIA